MRLITKVAYTPGITYATWNPSDKAADVALSNGNLTASRTTGGSPATVRATVGKSSGKWYWEMTIGAATIGGTHSGVCDNTVSLTSFLGNNATGWIYFDQNGNKINNSISTAYGASYTGGDVLMFALDMNSGKVWFGKNGTWQASGDPGAGTNEAFSGLSGTIYPAYHNYYAADNATVNFGASAFSYSVPSGFNSGVY